MRTKITLLFIGLLAFAGNVTSAALEKPIFVNFGLLSTDLPWATYAPWNTFQNCYAANTGNGVDNLLDSLGNQTGVKIQVTTSFGGYNAASGIASTTTVLNMPDKVSLSNFYGNTQLPASSQLTISNLDPTKAYSFICFSARSGSGAARNTQFTFTGTNTKSANHNSLGNTTEVSNVENVMPDANGTILLNVGFAPGFSNYYYISALKIQNYSPGATTAVDQNKETNLKFSVQPYDNTVRLNFYSVNQKSAILRIYNMQGQLVREQPYLAAIGENSVDINFAGKGLYVAKLTIGNKSGIARFVK